MVSPLFFPGHSFVEDNAGQQRHAHPRGPDVVI